MTNEQTTMKVLWITNVTFPEAKGLLNQNAEMKGSGGWLTSLADALVADGKVELHVASISSLVKELTMLKGQSLVYHILPVGNGDKKYNSSYEALYREVCNSVKPDVVHIHGTEYPHSLAALRACGYQQTVVSIQGLVSVIARYNRGCISKWKAIKNLTFHDIVRGGILRQQREMLKNGRYEEQLLREAKYVMGRTSFDREHLWAINSDAEYFHCGEILRKEFYEGRKWDYKKCTQHSIFMSQGAFPIKGLHVVVKSLSIVIRHYPDVRIRVAGRDILFRNGEFRDRFRITGYGKILRKLIRKYRLDEHITFTGPLNAREMVEEYLGANLFLCPSSIENSPNSLAEAQVLGVPCIASYVGGIPDMMKGVEENLYRFDDAEMLAYKIYEVFDRKMMCDEELLAAHNERHDVKKICQATLNAYQSIAGGAKR